MLKLNYKKIFIFIATMTLVSCCVTHPKKPVPLDSIQESIREGLRDDQKIANHNQTMHVPAAVSKSLMPSARNLTSPNPIAQRRFDVIADKMSTKVFFMGLVEGTPYNMVVAPSIEGTVSVNLKNVTIQEAMEAVRDMYGYEYRRTSYGFQVLQPEIKTEIFTLNYIDVKRSGKSITKAVSGQVSDKVANTSTGSSSNSGTSSSSFPGQLPDESSVSSSSIDTTSETNFWKSLATTLKDMVGTTEGRSVVVNPESGIIIIHAFHPELRQVARYLDRLQTNIQRQVVLEAKVLEVTLDDAFQSGIDWSLLGNPTTGDALLSQTATGNSSPNIRSFDTVFTVTMKGSFRNLIKLLQAQGNVQVLSSPRISTVNNQKAIIKVGQDEFFVTGVSTSNNIVNNGLGSTTTPTQDVTLTPFFSGVTLDVTPQISREGTVILHIHPSVSDVREQQKDITLGNTGITGTQPNTLVLPLALSTIRESDNIVRAKSGQVVVIGGLMANTMSEGIAGVPYLSKLPFVGAFFRRTTQLSKKTELVILLRPLLLNNQTIADTLMRADKNMYEARRHFHAGGRPDVFGNEGEYE